MIDAHFGTFRGLIRLALSYPETFLGIGLEKAVEPSLVRRLVFVCHGNICRSAFVHRVAEQEGLSAASFGLSTQSGKSAYGGTIEAAQKLGYDLSAHRSTSLEDFLPEEGDLLLAMEVRQLRKIRAEPRLAGLPRTLLGLFSEPIMPHIHDPYELSPAYMERCLGRLASTVPRLRSSYVNAALD